MKPVSFDGNAINDGTSYRSAIMRDGFGLPQVNAQLVGRSQAWPLIGAINRPGQQLFVSIVIVGTSSLSTLRKQLHQYFDPEDETPKKLLVEDDTGGNNRYVYAICERLSPTNDSLLEWVATLRIHGDVRWRENTATTSSWNITASGQTKLLTNNGQDDAYPILTITPTLAKTGTYNYAYKRFIIVRWRAEHAAIGYGATNYPVDICNDSFNTATLVSGGKMQADGDDLRVIVDGVEQSRWLDGINTTTTKVWVNMNFSPPGETTLGTSIGTGDATISAPAFTSIGEFPSQGILLIDSELITYTGINYFASQFTGCTRGAKGTTAATHTAGAAIYWIQHDVWIMYGNSSVSAPTTDDNYEPMFSKSTSTNTSWDYDSFREDAKPNRTGSWSKVVISDAPTHYGGNEGTTASPYVELGISAYTASLYIISAGTFEVYNNCGITAANFQNGEKWTNYISGWSTFSPVKVQSFIATSGYWTDEYIVPVPSVASTWESWSQNITLTSTGRGVRQYVTQPIPTYTNKCEAADVTLTLSSTLTPAITINSEQNNYSLSCTITNNTTGDAIKFVFVMALNADLEVNTDDKTVIYLADNSVQISTLTLIGGPRRDWLKLEPGNNTLQFDDTGTNGVSIDFSWEERHYQ